MITNAKVSYTESSFSENMQTNALDAGTRDKIDKFLFDDTPLLPLITI